MNNPKKDSLISDLIASITNEANYFNMSSFLRTPSDGLPEELLLPIEGQYYDVHNEAGIATCKTAACMAGHLEAVRPEVAKAILAEQSAYRGISHQTLASEIWFRETGEDFCPLDFMGCKMHFRAGLEMETATPQDAVKHILGQHADWPLLDNTAHEQELDHHEDEGC